MPDDMTHPRVRKHIATFVAATLLVVAATAVPVLPAGTPAPVLDAFQSRLKAYLQIRDKADAALPHLSKQSSPEEVVKHQRALAERIRTARAGARAGEFFTPEIEALVKRTMTEVLSGPDGKSIKASILDENPEVKSLALHQQYPASVPLSTMPAQVLASLPPLPKGLEYRFLGSRLVLLDTDADMVIDYTGGVLPA